MRTVRDSWSAESEMATESVDSTKVCKDEIEVAGVVICMVVSRKVTRWNESY
jgi:hypothetical protein